MTVSPTFLIMLLIAFGFYFQRMTGSIGLIGDGGIARNASVPNPQSEMRGGQLDVGARPGFGKAFAHGGGTSGVTLTFQCGGQAM